MHKKYIGIMGLILALYGIFSAIKFGNIFWYTYFTIGGTLFLGYINYSKKNENILTNFEKNPKRILKIYLFYVLMAVVTEYLGRVVLNMWIFGPFNTSQVIIHGFLIGYPFAFFFVYESFILIKEKIKSFNLAFIITTLLNAFLHEFPNTFAWAWTYTLNFGFEIFRINIWIIIAWAILVEIPIIINQKVK